LQRSHRLLRSAIIFISAVLIASTSFAPYSARAFAEDHPERKVRTRVEPVYPDIARKMNLNGTVRVQVVISPNGSVKETKVIGGHPILVTAAVDAVKKWKFDPANAETTGILEFKFDPGR
jgi:TonB family protein